MMIQTIALAALLAASGQAVSAQVAALRVVVIEGEDAVNIIQQKTAVRPIVEVRDRNDLPVAGALVTFSIPGGASTFGGAATLTVATNAAGQAAVTGLTPSVAGAFQIQVSAAFQGQIATATIAQTNVLTAAQAVAAGAATGTSGSAGSAGGGAGGAGGGAGGAGGASGAGGAAAGGAGLSTTTLVVAGAAVAAGGAVAATQLGDKQGGGESRFEGTLTGTLNGTFSSSAQSCTYSRSINGTARLKFRDFSDSNANGEFEWEGTSTLISATCPDQRPTDFRGALPVSGSPASISGNQTVAGPPGTGQTGETITGQTTLTFQGSTSGDTASGTFTFRESSVARGGNLIAEVNQLGTATFSITFRKVQ
jgi:hypothetical protein